MFCTAKAPFRAAAFTVIAVVLLTVPVAPTATATVPDAVLVIVPVINAASVKLDVPDRVNVSVKSACVRVIVEPVPTTVFPAPVASKATVSA